jgi:glutamate-1-semialdehyde aminotransferase
MPVINFLQNFQQKSLFGHVNLDLRQHIGVNLRETLSHILPSIDNINSISGETITQLVSLCNANSEAAMAMMKMARFLDIS